MNAVSRFTSSSLSMVRWKPDATRRAGTKLKSVTPSLRLTSIRPSLGLADSTLGSWAKRAAAPASLLLTATCSMVPPRAFFTMSVHGPE